MHESPVLEILLIQPAFADHGRSFDDALSEMVVIPEDLLILDVKVVLGADEGSIVGGRLAGGVLGDAGD